MLLGGCASRQPTPPPPEFVAATSAPSSLTVDDVQLQVQNRLPARIVVIARGTFPDTCTRIERISVGDPQPENVIPVALVASRPADAACAQTVTPFEEQFQLPVENLPPGIYTVDVQGHTATIELTVESAVQNSPGIIQPSHDGCPLSSQDTPVYISARFGLCFLFVQGFEVQEMDRGSGSILISGPAAEEEGPEPIGPSLIISVWQDGVDQPVSDFVDGLLAEAEQASDLTRSQAEIGGYPAEVVEGIPGNVPSRQAWINVNGTVLHFLLQPVDLTTYPAASAQAEELWSTVIGSLAFLPDWNFSTSNPGTGAAWQTYDLPEFGVRLAAPSDWTLFRGEGFAALGMPDGNPNLVTIGDVEDLPQDPAALTDALLARYQSQGEPDAEAGPMLVDGVQAVRFTGLQSLCLDVFVPSPDAGVVRQISVHRDACPDGAPTDTVIDILDSIELTQP